MTPYNLRAKALQAVALAALLTVGYTVWAAIVITGHRRTNDKP
jgi:hypothetical protein